MTAQKKQERKVTFEQALARLEEIVSKIESGEVPLEESIARYAEGIELIKQCRRILDSAEEKIQLLTKGEAEALEVQGDLAEQEE